MMFKDPLQNGCNTVAFVAMCRWSGIFLGMVGGISLHLSHCCLTKLNRKKIALAYMLFKALGLLYTISELPQVRSGSASTNMFWSTVVIYLIMLPLFTMSYFCKCKKCKCSKVCPKKCPCEKKGSETPCDEDEPTPSEESEEPEEESEEQDD